VTSTEILANLAITPGLAAFRARYPDLKVDLLITDDQLDLERGEADIALRAGLALPESDLIARKIGEFPFALYASRDYLLRKGLPRSVEDLRHHDLIAGDGPASPLPAVEWMFAQVPGLQPAARSNSMTNMLHALKVGMGVGPIGCLVGDLEPELVRIMVVPDILPSAWIVTRRELKDAPRVRAFIDFLVPHFTQLQKSMVARGEVAQREKRAELEAALAAGQTA
jgi:DNA-binding transcriptional LysR family regulator